MKEAAITELNRRKRLMAFQIRGLIDERADIQSQRQEHANVIQSLKAQLGEAFQEQRNFNEAQVNNKLCSPLYQCLMLGTGFILSVVAWMLSWPGRFYGQKCSEVNSFACSKNINYYVFGSTREIVKAA